MDIKRRRSEELLPMPKPSSKKGRKGLSLSKTKTVSREKKGVLLNLKKPTRKDTTLTVVRRPGAIKSDAATESILPQEEILPPKMPVLCKRVPKRNGLKGSGQSDSNANSKPESVSPDVYEGPPPPAYIPLPPLEKGPPPPKYIPLPLPSMQEVLKSMKGGKEFDVVYDDLVEEREVLQEFRKYAEANWFTETLFMFESSRKAITELTTGELSDQTKQDLLKIANDVDSYNMSGGEKKEFLRNPQGMKLELLRALHVNAKGMLCNSWNAFRTSAEGQCAQNALAQRVPSNTSFAKKVRNMFRKTPLAAPNHTLLPSKAPPIAAQKQRGFRKDPEANPFNISREEECLVLDPNFGDIPASALGQGGLGIGRKEWLESNTGALREFAGEHATEDQLLAFRLHAGTHRFDGELRFFENCFRLNGKPELGDGDKNTLLGMTTELGDLNLPQELRKRFLHMNERVNGKQAQGVIDSTLFGEICAHMRFHQFRDLWARYATENGIKRPT